MNSHPLFRKCFTELVHETKYNQLLDLFKDIVIDVFLFHEVFAGTDLVRYRCTQRKIVRGTTRKGMYFKTIKDMKKD